MKMDFISVTQLQRNTKKVLSDKPFQIILNNNESNGMILSKQAADILTR